MLCHVRLHCGGDYGICRKRATSEARFLLLVSA